MGKPNRNRMVPKQYLGAFKKGHRFSSRADIDEDLSWELLDKIEESNYTDTASMEALAYITKFNNEWHKNVIKKGDESALHNTDTLRKGLYSRQNAKNRDLMSIKPQVSMKEVLDEPSLTVKGSNKHASYVNDVEDAIIELLDSTKANKNMY